MKNILIIFPLYSLNPIIVYFYLLLLENYYYLRKKLQKNYSILILTSFWIQTAFIKFTLYGKKNKV